MVTLLVVSSENIDPMQEFQKLSGKYRSERKRIQEMSDEKEKAQK